MWNRDILRTGPLCLFLIWLPPGVSAVDVEADLCVTMAENRGTSGKQVQMMMEAISAVAQSTMGARP